MTATPYTSYIASQIARALHDKADPEKVLRHDLKPGIGAVHKVWGSYEIPLTDFNGTEYRVTIEVEP